MTAELPPTDATLRRFLLGDLPPAELEAVGRYLDDHPHVATTLVDMKADDTLLSALRGPAEASDAPDVVAAVARAAGLVGGEPPTESLAPPPVGDPTADEVADAVAAVSDADADDPFAALAPAEAEGELGRLGGYRVLRLLGQGGMGAVFEAADDRLGRRVALKVMLPTLAAKPASRQRFLREARAAAAVEHDHIVPIYQTGEDRGVPFLAMPLLAGETLDDRLHSGRPLAVADVLRIGREVAEGLAAAHAAGLVHRDIKPSNVWLERTPGGAFKRTRILDFGLARSATGADGLTASGAIVGTPAYMAPEQARGAAVDARADLFSLGCVLYRAAAGRRPFPGNDTFAVLTALATTEPPAASEVNPAVPAGLSNLITRLLAKDPAGRPASARAVADELARLASEPARDSITHIAGTGPALPPAAGRPGGDTTEAFEPAAPRRAARRRWRVAAAVLFVAVAGLAAANGPTIVRVATNQGELVVEVDDPNTEVVVKGGAVELRRDEDGKKRVYLVTATKDGEVEVREPGSTERLVMEKFQLRRGGDVLVKVTAEKLAAARRPQPASGQPKQQAPTPLTPAQRAAVEWVLANDGVITVFKDGRDVTVGGAEDELKRLPPEPLPVVGVRFSGGFPLTAAARSVLAELPPTVWFLGLLNGAATTDADLDTLSRQPWFAGVEAVRLHGQAALTDAGLAHLTRAPRLKDVGLSQLPRVTDRGLEHLRALPLVTLGIEDTPLLTGTFLKAEGRWQTLANLNWGRGSHALREEEFVHLTGYTGLNAVSLVLNDRVTDASLDQLAKCKSLRYLYVKQTKVMDTGVEKLAAARPDVRIEWDGPTIEPRPAPKLPAGDTPPATDAFPGRLVFHDTFNDPKTGTVFQGTRAGQRSVVENGAYRVETATAKANTAVTATFGPTAPDVAFVTRTKVENGSNQIVFRVRTMTSRGNWLLVRISPAGRWSVGRIDMTYPGGTRQDKWTPLAEATADDPALAVGKWVSVAGRAVGKDYEVWVNGMTVARGTDDPALDGPNIFTAAVQASAVVSTDGPAAVTVDYAAVWDLSPATSPPVPLTPAQRAAVEALLAGGGSVEVIAPGADGKGEATVRVGPQDRLPPVVLRVDTLDITPHLSADLAAKLRDLPPVGILHLGYTPFTDEDFARLAAIPGFAAARELQVQGTQITDAGMAEIARFRNLSYLHVGDTRITPAGLAGTRGLKLGTLCIGRNPGGDGWVDAVLANPTLSSVTIYATPISPAALARLKGAPALYTLIVGQETAIPAALDALAGATQVRHLSAQATPQNVGRFAAFTHLTELDLRGSDPAVLVAFVEPLGKMTALRSLNIQIDKTTRADVDRLAAARPDVRIEWNGPTIEPKASLPAPPTPAQRAAVAELVAAGFTVQVQDTDGKVRDAKTVSDLRPGSRLYLLARSAVASPLDPAALAALRAVPPDWTAGLTLQLTGPVTAEQFRRAADIPLAQTVTVLYLDRAGLTVAGYNHLARFAALRALHIGAAGSETTPPDDDALKAIAGATTNVNVLTLSNSKVTGVGLAALRREPLGTLTLQGCKAVDDAGAVHLAAIQTLNTLSLNATAVTDAAVPQLCRLMALRELNVNNTKVTAAGVDQLRAALPNCRIVWSGPTIEPRPAP
ncbi:MAG TPA: protein kinase [Urbifossiella sp.]|nr:protein kinase [Urbifossiella sp.]